MTKGTEPPVKVPAAVSRGTWLMDPDRERTYSVVDPRPIEAAQLESKGDTMMEMIRGHLRRQREELQEELPDDEFISDDLLDLDEAITPHEAADMASPPSSLEAPFEQVASKNTDAAPQGAESNKPQGVPAAEENPPPASPPE